MPQISASQSNSNTSEASHFRQTPSENWNESVDSAASAMTSLAIQHSASSLNAAIASEPLVEFTLFPNLAAELRIKIWREVLSEPEICHIEAYSTFITRNPNTPVKSALLYVSKEARAEAMQSLRPIFQRDDYRKAFINPAMDMLFLSFSVVFSLTELRQSTIRNLKTVAIDGIKLDHLICLYNNFAGLRPGELIPDFERFLAFRALDEFVVVVRGNQSRLASAASLKLYDVMLDPIDDLPPLTPLSSRNEESQWATHTFTKQALSEDSDLLRPDIFCKRHELIIGSIAKLSEMDPGWKVPRVVYKGIAGPSKQDIDSGRRIWWAFQSQCRAYDAHRCGCSSEGAQA